MQQKEGERNCNKINKHQGEEERGVIEREREFATKPTISRGIERERE